MKIKAKTKDCHLIVRVKMSFGESIDDTVYDRFARTYLRGFLKPNRIRKNQIEYTGPIGITLYERMKKPITKHDFLLIIEQLVIAVQKLQSNRLFLNHVLLDVRDIYINEVTKEIQLIYVPSDKIKNQHTVMELMETIAYSAIPAAESDPDFVSRFIYCMRSMKDFNGDKFESFIQSEDKSVIATIKKQNAGQSGFMTNKPQHYYEHYDAKNSRDDEATGLLDEDEATGLLQEDEATGLLDEPETALLYDDATGLLEDDGTALLETAVHYATLVRVMTGESILVNKAVFRLGKERSYVDYFVTNNNAVSRSHADIVTRGNRYFVIDLNSKNRTYINEQVLMPHSETEIRDGDTLRLANEEFVFYT